MVLDFASWCHWVDRISTTGNFMMAFWISFIYKTDWPICEGGNRQNSRKCIILIAVLQVHTLFVKLNTKQDQERVEFSRGIHCYLCLLNVNKCANTSSKVSIQSVSIALQLHNLIRLKKFMTWTLLFCVCIETKKCLHFSWIFFRLYNHYFNNTFSNRRQQNHFKLLEFYFWPQKSLSLLSLILIVGNGMWIHLVMDLGGLVASSI